MGRAGYARSRWGALLLLYPPVANLGCTSLASVDVTYRQCVPIDGIAYSERFDGTLQELADCDWKMDTSAEGSKLFLDNGDLVVRPARGLQWFASASAAQTTRGPLFFRQMPGDFLVITRAEATSTIKGDHCQLNHEEAAGLAVRRAQPFGWSTLLVRPYFDPSNPKEIACTDGTSQPPTARAQARAYGFGPMNDKEVTNIGKDGEAYIAVCRQNDELAYYYGIQGPDPNAPVWKSFAQQVITREPVDVGLTTSGAPFEGEGAEMEGHFTWAVFRDYSKQPVADGCEGALAAFRLPEEE
jgi:hypothetical protein